MLTRMGNFEICCRLKALQLYKPLSITQKRLTAALQPPNDHKVLQTLLQFKKKLLKCQLSACYHYNLQSAVQTELV